MIALTISSAIALGVLIGAFGMLILYSVWMAIQDFQVKRKRGDNFVSPFAVRKANVIDDDGHGMPLNDPLLKR